MNGNVAPMQTHQGRMEAASAHAEKKRKLKESVWPATDKRCAPRVNRLGTANAPSPITNSTKAYRYIADSPVLSERAATHRPPAQDPRATPTIKTEITTESTGVMIPNAAKAIRVQTTW